MILAGFQTNQYINIAVTDSVFSHAAELPYLPNPEQTASSLAFTYL